MSKVYKYKNHILILGALVVFAIWSFYPSEGDYSDQDTVQVEEILEEIPEPQVDFGLTLDSFEVHQGNIKENQFLADILLKHHIPYPEIDRLVKKAVNVFDVRKIASGKPYTILSAKDSTEKAQYFIYEPSALQYVVYDLRDTMNVYIGDREFEMVEKTAYGTINSSLYQTLVDNNASAELAMELATIYAWTIDFYRIQKGDSYKVIYEEKMIGDKSVGVGKIKAVLFHHKNDDFYAFRFEQGDNKDFFDEKANGMRKAFLKAPLKYSRISSGFTKKRFHPVQQRWKAHLGTDYAAPTGTPILSVGDGEVIEAKYKKYNGNYVKVRHNSTYTTQYLHMSKIAKGMTPGRRVKQGEVIGYVGSTGLATGPHVCFRFWKNGEQVNHLAEKFPSSEPVKKENLDAYNILMQEMKLRIDAIGEVQVES